MGEVGNKKPKIPTNDEECKMEIICYKVLLRDVCGRTEECNFSICKIS